jgi:Transglutaminase-like superfamily
MRQLLICLLFIVLFIKKGAAQNETSDFKNIDSLAIHTPQYSATKMDELVHFCTLLTHSPLEQVRFYFVWTATHIHYDTLELSIKNRQLCKQNVDSVFTHQKAICRGYTDLFNLLCTKSGIEAQSIIGYSKTVEGKIDTTFLHAWSAIKIQGKWSLFDVTWASNHFENTNKIDADFNEYFNQSAFPFIKRHLPFDPIWQLKDSILSAASFFAEIPLANKEEIPTTPFFNNFNKILEEELRLEPTDQSIKSLERAIQYNPSEKRLYGILNYYKSQKALVSFNKANNLLLKFKNGDDDWLKKWTFQDIANLISDAQKAYNQLSNALTIYESMTYVTENKDTQLIQTNMISIKKNKDLTVQLINYLKTVKDEMSKIPYAKTNR